MCIYRHRLYTANCICILLIEGSFPKYGRENSKKPLKWWGTDALITHELDVWKLLLAGVFLFIQPVSVDFELLLNIMSRLLELETCFCLSHGFERRYLTTLRRRGRVCIYFLFRILYNSCKFISKKKNGGLFISLVACLAWGLSGALFILLIAVDHLWSRCHLQLEF